MKFLVFLLLLPILGPLLVSSSAKIASVYWDAMNGRFYVSETNVSGAIAWATFTDDIQKTGWSYLEVYTNPKFLDYHQAFAAGMVEAHLTSDLIKKQWSNQFSKYCAENADYCEKLKDYLHTNLDYMINQTAEHSLNDSYWHQVGLTLVQLAGLQNGLSNEPYILYNGQTLRPNVSSTLILNLHGDLDDLQVVFNWTGVNRRGQVKDGSCSALVKLVQEGHDLYFSHVTWTAYNSMLRIMKKYSFQFHKTFLSDEIIPGNVVTFSSYPGRLFSGDDFYLISSGLATMETTIGNQNRDLWKFVQPLNTVQEWIRNTVANRLAVTGQEWVNIFKEFNSGTYNNQWMVLDYKRFTPGSPLKDGLLWILEQLPGYTEQADVTDVLRTQGFWPSYNSPYFKKVFNMSGFPDLVKKYGDWYTYEKTPRALIFKRDQGKVNDIQSMMKLMRYNDFQHDPLSRCDCVPPYSSENAISARSDLNPANGTYPFPALGRRPHGGTDLKLTNYTLFQKLEFWGTSGPTFDPLPPFQWSKSGFNALHDGHPDLWNFQPVLHHWGP